MEWLLRENDEFRNKYQDSAGKTNVPNRAEAVNDRVVACLEDLVLLDLLLSRPAKAERGGEMTTEYKFTHFGFIIALLLECDRTKDKEYVYDTILEVFEFYWTTANSSADIFSRISRISRIRQFNDMLCVHAQCNNCHSDFYAFLHVLKYLDGMFLDSELLPSLICESCNVANLSIDRFYDK